MSIPTSFMTIAGENQGEMHRVFWPVFDTDRLFVFQSGASGTGKIELSRRRLFHVTAAWRIHQKYSKLYKRRKPLESQSHN